MLKNYLNKNINFTEEIIIKRFYASIAGKNKYLVSCFDKETKKNVINNHAQFFTDFDLIYDDPKQARIYSIGTLCTNIKANSLTLSLSKNYMNQEKSQNLVFFEKPILASDKLHVFKNSKEYFQNIELQSKIKTSPTYLKLKNDLLQELKEKNISVRFAITPEDYNVTALNILCNTKDINSDSLFISTFIINKNE